MAGVLGYVQYRNFETVIAKAKEACFNSGQRLEDHFADASKMIEIGKGGMRTVADIYLSRYACYLIVQNADPSKPVVATGQTHFAVQTRRQERPAGMPFWKEAARNIPDSSATRSMK